MPPDSNGPAASMPYVRVSAVTGGVAIRIELDGQGAPDTFFSRYGPLWQHMLTSFATFTPPWHHSRRIRAPEASVYQN